MILKTIIQGNIWIIILLGLMSNLHCWNNQHYYYQNFACAPGLEDYLKSYNYMDQSACYYKGTRNEFSAYIYEEYDFCNDICWYVSITTCYDCMNIGS